MKEFADKEGTGERGGKFEVGFAQQAKPSRLHPNWQRRGNMDKDHPELGPVYIEDVAIVKPEKGIFAVLDGVDETWGHSDRVARISASVIEETLATSQKLDSDREAIMRLAFQEARTKISEDGDEGKTTASVVWSRELPSGQYELTIGHIGDGSIYTLNKNTGVVSVETERQRTVHSVVEKVIVENWIGRGADSRKINQSDQIRTIIVDPSTRLLLCTDGTIGALQDEELTDEEISRCLRTGTPQEAADALIATSKTDDDKTALVIDLK